MNQQLMNFAANMMKQNPRVANTPMGQQFVQILRSGDQNAGMQMADNLLQSAGVSREEGIRQARSMFGI